ncbi:MAG: hypothetical protein U0992_01355 [Planctomycetaceae bacterium]
MSRRFPLEIAAACLTILTAARLASAQAAPQAPADQPAATQSTLDIVISDEPRTIDPATLVPQRLAQPATVQFDNASLNEVVEWLRDDQKINSIADAKHLQDAGISLGEPITDALNNEPLYLLLNRLRVVGVTWSYRDDILRLMPANMQDQPLRTQPYPVGDLFDAGYQSDAVLDSIRTCTGSKWESEEGSGGEVQALGDVLFIRQTEQGHREIAGLLAALRKHGRRTFTYDEPQHFAIREKLNAPVSLDVQDAPLIDVLADIAQQAAVEIRTDAAAFREERVRDREPVSATLSAQPMHVVLQAVLTPLKLDWVLRDGILWATSADEASQTQKTAMFDVRDLCRDDSESEALKDAIVEYTAGPWSTGAGQHGRLEFARSGTMVVRQTEGQLDAILQLLEDYRTALRSSKRRARTEEKPDDIITRYYRLQSQIATELRQYLPALVEPGSWRNDQHPDANGTIFQLASVKEVLDSHGNQVVENAKEQGRNSAQVVEYAVLIIQQKRATHEKIAELIDKVENGESQGMGMGGMGMGGGMGGFGGGYFSTREHPLQKP